MIRGNVRNREPIIELDVYGPTQSTQAIDVVIDMGFNGYLTLPADLVAAMELSFAGYRTGALADGTVVRLDVYVASVKWHGRSKDVLILQTGDNPLLGMALLAGSRLTMDADDDGEIVIEPLPARSN